MDKDIPFSGYTKAKGVYKHIKTSFLQEMQSIKNGDYETEVMIARRKRAFETEEAYNKYRRENVWCFTPAINSKKDSRANPEPDELTGLAALDIDDLSQNQKINKEKLKKYPWVVAIGHSIGGIGLFAMIKCEPGRFKDSHASALKILSDDGIKGAKGQKDENRLRFTSWDPELWYNENPALAPNVPIILKDEKQKSIITNRHNVPSLLRSNDQEHIFQSIVRITSNGLSEWPNGERHGYLIGVISWCNHIGMSESFAMEMAEKHCRPMMENGHDYDIEIQVKDWYKRYSDQHNTTIWKEHNQPPAPLPNVPEFIPDWNNKPPYVAPVLKLAGINILTYQNISAIIAAPGSGKTSCIEAIAASFLNPLTDCLGFEVDPQCKGVIIIDSERTKTDVWNSFYRMCRRAGIEEGSELGNVLIIGMRGISDPEERKKIIEKYISAKEFSLLLIDGVADLVRDTNNIEQAKNAQDWLRYLTATHDLSILCTIHPNPGSTKARGNTGGEMLRDSETVLLIKDFEGAKILTSDFEHGKNRNTAKLTHGFKWSEEKMMFISVDYESLVTDKKAALGAQKKNEAEKLARKILKPPCAMKPEMLKSAIMQETGITRRTAHEQIKDWIAHGFISKLDDYYRLII